MNKIVFFSGPSISALASFSAPSTVIYTIWLKKKIYQRHWVGWMVPIIFSPICQPLFLFSRMMPLSPLALNKKRSRHTIDNIISAILPNDASIIYFLEQTCMPSLASPRLLSQSLDLVLAEKKVVCSRYILHILSSG